MVTRPRWGLRAATALSVLVLGAGAIGHAMLTGLDTGISRVDPFRDMKNRPEGGHGMNLLLVGTDGRERITPEQKKKFRLGGAPCHCTDTIMLVHISRDSRRASVVSLPRDSYAEIPAYTDRATGQKRPARPVKLNAAYAEGGPSLTVRTVEHMTKVKIDHYLEVDFTSFMKTVDAVGGVRICTSQPMSDRYTGLNLPAGSHELNGGQALQYVRSRHVDIASDLGRMQRQQRFVASLIERATSSGMLLNPVRFRKVATTMLGSVRADEGFGTEEMLALGRAMRGFSAASSEFTSVPIGSMGTVKGVGSAVKWDPAKSQRLFRMIREDRPLAPARARKARATLVDVSPQQIRVQVYNGTGEDGLGRRVDGALRATGFNTTRTPLNGDSPEVERTFISYDPRWDRSARTLATALRGCEIRAVKGQGRTLRVTAGADYRGVTPVRAQDAYQGEFGAVTGDEVTCP
ncbi:LytR family transcriptional regulator [Streptomyces inusitatus]|uniref:LytR family transcriptional regulator n=1 Tax=Streptomyces inusitatus TaxID=68221 RepID=A0A918V377_9ACTN|nr:LytR family transcriptional regulator [Streptomyces inusitatus]